MRLLLMILLAGLSVLPTSFGRAEEQKVEPNVIACIMAVRTMDKTNADYMLEGCLSVVEHYCLEQETTEQQTACLDRATSRLQNHRNQIIALLPKVPDHLSGFRKSSYKRHLERVTSDQAKEGGCHITASETPFTPGKLCEVVDAWGDLTTVFYLARIANVSLP